MQISISALLCLLLLLCLDQVMAEAAIEKEATVAVQIKTLDRKIRQSQEMLQKTRGKQSALEKNLETIEKQINDIVNNIIEVQLKIDAGELRLTQLLQDKSRLEQKKNQQQTLIGQQIRIAYELGQQPYLKLLLNLEEPARLSRMLTYYDYVNRARSTQIAEYETLLSQMAVITQDISAQNKQLRVRRAQSTEQKSGLLRVRQQRQQTLALLNLEIKQTGKTLQQRLEDRRQLEALLGKINTGFNNLRPGAESFAQRKGKLLLPVAGKLLHKFGKRRNSKLKWRGVFIAAPRGTPVQSVHTGQVVFADWLRGFGLLIIINHGQGYLSLYGHNQVLYRQAGEWIAAGEAIAAVGDSGGQTQAGLYFEIRSAGKPADPQAWCQVRPAQTKRV